MKMVDLILSLAQSSQNRKHSKVEAALHEELKNKKYPKRLQAALLKRYKKEFTRSLNHKIALLRQYPGHPTLK